MKTIKLKGNDYAQVKERLIQFRTENPRGLIETMPTIQADGQILFKTRIVKDKSDVHSAEATGHALGKNSGDKQFEKLETISVGRALALLGYGADGAIASSEEMEEFETYKKEKHAEAKQIAIEALNGCTSLVELKDIFDSLHALRGDAEIIKLKDELKLKLK